MSTSTPVKVLTELLYRDEDDRTRQTPGESHRDGNICCTSPAGMEMMSQASSRDDKEIWK